MITNNTSAQFIIQCNNEKIWNLLSLVEFLNLHQNSSIVMGINPEAISFTSIGLYDLLDKFRFEKVTLITQNPFEFHPRYEIVHFMSNWARLVFPQSNRYWKWNGSKKFLTIFGRPTANRIGLASHLFEYHKEQTHLHFCCKTEADDLQLYELDKLLIYDLDSIQPAGKLIKKLPLTVVDPSGYNRIFNNQMLYGNEESIIALYQDAFVDVVSESHVYGKTFYPTEKIFRAMWCKRPFIAFASIDFLVYLRQMGFQTFFNFWDEDYDGYEGRERYLKILKLIDFIGSKSESELQELYRDMQLVLEHNYNLLKNQNYQTKIHQIAS